MAKAKNLTQDVVRAYLAGSAAFFLFSSLVYAARGDTDRWFSRMALSLVCAGFLYRRQQPVASEPAATLQA